MMTVRNQLNQPGHFSSFQKQLSAEDEVDDDEDDDDNDFVISLEDNGEEEGLLCNPDEIDFSNGKLTIDISQTDISESDQSVYDFRKHSAKKVAQGEGTHILVLPSGDVTEATHNSHLLKTPTAHQPSTINASLSCSSNVTVSDSNYGVIENSPFSKAALAKEKVSSGFLHSSHPMKSSLNFSVAETVHLDSGGIWSEAIFLSTSKGAFVNNNSNCNRDSDRNDNCNQKTGPDSSKTISVRSPNHSTVPASLESGYMPHLTGPKSSFKNVLNLPLEMSLPSSTVSTTSIYTVPRLSGPFPRSDRLPGSSEGNLESNFLNVMNNDRTKNDTSQGDTCTCVMCYKGRGIKDPDMLVEKFYVQRKQKNIPNLLKRKQSRGTLDRNKKHKSLSDSHFINISNLSNVIQGNSNSPLTNITLRNLISAPPLTTSLASLENDHAPIYSSASTLHPNMGNLQRLVSSPLNGQSKSTASTKVFLSPNQATRQKSMIPTTVTTTSATAHTTGLPCELNKIASALSSPHVTPSIDSPLMSTHSNQMPYTLYYVDSDRVIVRPQNIGIKNKDSLKSLAAGIQKDLDSVSGHGSAVPLFMPVSLDVSPPQVINVTKNALASPQCIISSRNSPNSSTSINLPKVDTKDLNTTRRLCTQTIEHSDNPAVVKPTILTAPPKDNIYTKSLLKINLLSPKSADSLVPLTIDPSSVSNTSLHPKDNSKPSAVTNLENSQIILNLITRHLQERPVTANSTILQTLLKEVPPASVNSDNETQGETYTNVQEQRHSILNNSRVIKRTLDFVTSETKCHDTASPQPPEERIPKSYIQDWVNEAKNLTTANLKNGEYLEAIDYLEQPTEDTFGRDSSDKRPVLEQMDIKPFECLASRLQNNNIEITSFSGQTLIKKEIGVSVEPTCPSVNISTGQAVCEINPTLPQSYQISSMNTSAVTSCLSPRSNSCTSTALSNQFSKSSEPHESSQDSIYSFVNAKPIPKPSDKKENEDKNSQLLISGNLLESCSGFGDNHFGKESKASATISKRRHSSTVLPSANGIKLKIKLSDLSRAKAVNRRLVDTVMSTVNESATKLSSEENTSRATELSNEITSALKVNLESMHDKVETAEEMFQRFQEQAMQEVFKAQMGVGQVSRSLRPTRPSASFMDKYKYRFSSGPLKRKKMEVEKHPVPMVTAAENGSINSGSVSHVSLDKENNLEPKKKKLLPEKSESVKQPRFSLTDFPKLRQDTSFTNKKKIYCTNILAGHQVYVKFNVFENTTNGRYFLVPFFNIGGSRTQFDVEDIEYISRAVVDYDKEERTCARHLLFYAREAKKATFLRKETNCNSINISEKSYKKSCFVLEGFQRTGIKKKTEPIVNKWKPDNSVDIEIDTAEVDDDAEKHFAEMIASETINMSQTVDSCKLEADSHLEKNILVMAGKCLSTESDPVLKTATSEVNLSARKGIASEVKIQGNSISAGIKESCSTYTDVLKQVVATEQLMSDFDKHTTPVIKEEPLDDGYGAALNSSYISNEQMSQPFKFVASKDVTNIKIKQEIVDGNYDAETGIIKLPESAEITTCQANFEDNPSLLPKPSTIQTFDGSEKFSSESTIIPHLQSCISDQVKELAEKTLVTLEGKVTTKTVEPASLNKDEDKESLVSQGSDMSSSSDDSDENIDNLGELDTSLSKSLGNASGENLHPMQNKITSLVQSLMQRLTQDSPKLPSWLVSETPQIITAKIKHKKAKVKNGDTLVEDETNLTSNATQSHTAPLHEPSTLELSTAPQPQGDASLNISLSSSSQGAHCLSELLVPINKQTPNSSTHLSNVNSKMTSQPESISAHMSSAEVESISLISQKPYNDEIDNNLSTEDEIMRITTLAQDIEENKKEQQRDTHSLGTKPEKNLNLANIDPGELASNTCSGADVKSERSTPSDFEIEVGMEEFPSEDDEFRPIHANKVTWNSFSKPYSILVSKEITLPSPLPDSAIQGSKTPTITGSPKHLSSKTEKKNNKGAIKIKIKSNTETPKPEVAESVTSYLSNKLSATSAKAPRLLCNTSNKPSSKPVTLSAPAMPEPISTAELSKTPSLSEIFGIEIKKELIYETKPAQSTVKKATKSEGHTRSELRSLQMANKRNSTQMAKKGPSSQVAKKRTSKQVAKNVTNSQVAIKGTTSQIDQNITISQVANKGTTSQVDQNRTSSQVAKKRTSVQINKNQTIKRTRLSYTQSSSTKKSEETLDALEDFHNLENCISGTDVVDLAKSVRQCYVRLERMDIKSEPYKVALNENTKKLDTALMSSVDKVAHHSKSLNNNKVPQRTSRKQKRKSRGRTGPPRKDIVDYYTYMIESLQKKAQRLEEASKKERDEKEKKELEEKAKKAAEEKSQSLEKNEKTEDAILKTKKANLDQTELDRDASSDELNETNRVDSADYIFNYSTGGSETEGGDFEKTTSNSRSVESQQKGTEVDLFTDSYKNDMDRQEVNQIDSNTTTFGKKDVVLCSSLEEDIIKLTVADKQRLAVEEDLLLAPNINFDEEDEDMSSMMEVDVEKLLGLEKENFIVDSAPDEEKDGDLKDATSGQMLDNNLSEFTNDKSTSSDSTVTTLPQNKLSEMSQSLLLWKNIPEPELLEETPESSQTQGSLSSRHLKNLKFKLKCPVAELIKSIKLSKEIKNVFGEAASEGNSPTEKTKEEIAAKMVSQPHDPPKSQQPNELKRTEPPLPILKVKLHRETMDAIERAKAQFKLGKKRKKPKPLSGTKSSVDADTLKEQIAEDSKFYLRQSKLNQSLPDVSIKDRVAPKANVMQNLSTGDDNPKQSKDLHEAFSSEYTESSNSTKDGIFHNVHRFTDSENTLSSISEAPSKSNDNVDKCSSSRPVKCNVNIDIAKLKLRLNPLLSKKGHAEINQKDLAQNERPAENNLPLTTKEKSQMPTSVQKPLPALNTAKLSNILKIVCKQTNATKELWRDSERNESTAKIASKNTVEEGRTLRTRSKLQLNSPSKNMTRKSPRVVIKDSVSPKVSTEKEDVKGRSFFDCLQNVQDVNVSDCMRNEEPKYVGINSNDSIDILHPFHNK